MKKIFSIFMAVAVILGIWSEKVSAEIQLIEQTEISHTDLDVFKNLLKLVNSEDKICYVEKLDFHSPYLNFELVSNIAENPKTKIFTSKIEMNLETFYSLGAPNTKMIGYAEENGETVTTYFQENGEWKKIITPIKNEQIYFMQLMLTEKLLPYVKDAKILYSDKNDDAYIFKITFDAAKIAELPFEKNLSPYMNNSMVNEITSVWRAALASTGEISAVYSINADEILNISMDFSDVVKNLIKNIAQENITSEEDAREAEEFVAVFSESTMHFYRTRTANDKAAQIPFKVRKNATEVQLPPN